VGLDVHKRSVQACVLDPTGRKMHGDNFPCTRAALARFAGTWLGPQSACVLEATSHTWAICQALAPYGGQLRVSNPLQTKAIAQAKVKTDKIDAQVLAQLLRCDFLPEVWIVDEATRRLRQQVGRRTALVRQRTAGKNRIHSTLAAELIPVPVERLFSPAGQDWLETVEVDSRTRDYINSDLRLLAALDREIAGLDRQLAVQAYRQEQAKLLMTLPGVDYAVALTLLAALGDIHRFPDGDHAAGYLGLAPRTHQSGEHCYHGPITKHGNSHARWMLIEAAQHLDKHPGPLGAFFRRLAKKKNRNVAVAATARKLVTIAWLMLKTGEPYRYAQPATVQAKFSRLRIRAGAGKRRSGIPKGPGRHPHYGTGVWPRRIAPLQEVCQQEGLPEPTPLEQLPRGEQRMLRAQNLSGTVAAWRTEQFRPACPAGAVGRRKTAGGPSGPKPSSPIPTVSPSTTGAVRTRTKA
jgi:transposase